MLQIKIGDYFNAYKDGETTKRMIATSNSPNSKWRGNHCEAMTINPVCYCLIDVDNEIEVVLGNIFE